MQGAANRTTSREHFNAVLFDFDGVLTDTAKIHASCWKKMFDVFLQQHAAKTNQPLEPFDIVDDYRVYVDGKLRYDGVRSFLGSRNIHLPFGDPKAPPILRPPAAWVAARTKW